MDQKESLKTVETINYEDFSNLCRTCLGSLAGQTRPARIISDKLDDKQASGLSIGNLLKVFTTLDVASEDNKPQNLCCVCLDKLLGFHTFREMLWKNEEIINKAIQLYDMKNNGEQEDIGRFMDSEENAIFYLNSDEGDSIQDFIKEECSDYADEFSNGDHDYSRHNNELKPSEDTKESADATFINCSIENDDNSLNNDDVSKDNSFYESDNSNSENDDEIDDPDDNIDNDEPIEDDDSDTEFFKALFDNFGSDNDVGDTSNEEGASSDDAFINELLEAVKHQKYKCEHCDLEFEENNSLIKHKIKEHPLNLKKVQCEVCGRMIFNAMIDRHMKRHERAYECDICFKKFTMHSNLQRHKKLHSLNKSFMCVKCNQGFYRQESLNNHLKVHESKEGQARGSQETQFICDYCGKSFIRFQFYKRHLRVHLFNAENFDFEEENSEKKKTKYSCDICKKVYSSLGGLKTHKATHGEKNFLCPFCGQAFYHNTNLNFHLRTHTGEKPFQCTLCERKFAQKSTLDVHMIQHTGIKPHQCNICGKSFGQVPHLKHHLLSHTGEKPFPCSYCDKKFTTRTTCLAHMRAHVGIRPYVCEICGSCFYDSGTRSKHRRKAHPDYY